MNVTIILPDRGAVRTAPPEAAQLLVDAYGDTALDQAIAGLREAFDATWCEVDRLHTERRADVRCPRCGGRSFRAAYRVQMLCGVELARSADGEILIGPPGPRLAAAPEPTEADFSELRCGHCGARLDWEVDHRSLDVWERSRG